MQPPSTKSTASGPHSIARNAQRFIAEITGRYFLSMMETSSIAPTATVPKIINGLWKIKRHCCHKPATRIRCKQGEDPISTYLCGSGADGGVAWQQNVPEARNIPGL